LPYIPQKRRDEIGFDGSPPVTPGELNYVFTIEAIDYLDRQGLSYQTINDVLGALEGAKLEFYRRVAAPFEDAKCVQNGDVY
jgi:hypothetical protein